MSWKNIPLIGKFVIGFGAILVLLVLLSGWSYFGITNIVNDAEEVIGGNALRAGITEIKIAHLQWAGKVNKLLFDESLTKLTVQTDPHRCSFGKWFYGEGRQHAEAMVPGLADVLAKIEEPHRQMHESAKDIRDLFEQAAGSADLSPTAVTGNSPTDSKMQAELDSAFKEAREEARSIYFSRTLPALSAVGTVFDAIISSVDEHVLSDEGLLQFATKTRKGVVVVTVVAILAGIFLATIIARGIVVPIKASCAMILDLERGRLDRRLNMDRVDELGQMAKAMDSFADNLRNEVLGAFNSLAAGDFTFEAEGLIREPLARANKALCELVHQIQMTGEQITSGSLQISEAAQHLSGGTTESAASIEEISASMTEMASQIGQTAENADQANRLTEQAKDSAEKGNRQMVEMVQAMAGIAESGKNISRIIKVIDELAFQTNLLALNAAVEAARAGHHGKGFAVVADEVRSLANRSAGAARQTTQLIEESVQRTQNGTRIAADTEAALGEILDGIGTVSDLMSEIAAAANEQASGITQVNQVLMQIEQVTQSNTANAEESAASADELSGQAQDLKGMLSRFNVKSNVSYPEDVPPNAVARIALETKKLEKAGTATMGENCPAT